MPVPPSTQKIAQLTLNDPPEELRHHRGATINRLDAIVNQFISSDGNSSKTACTTWLGSSHFPPSAYTEAQEIRSGAS